MEVLKDVAVRGGAAVVVDGSTTAPIPETLFGLFFEDINFGADGGLYPELVRNRSFEFTEPLDGWSKGFLAEGQLIAMSEGGLNEKNPHFLRVRCDGPSGSTVTNGGFRGMGVREGAEHVFSAWVRLPGGTGPSSLHAALVAGRGHRRSTPS